jgi:serine/threonine-protein kinase
VERIVADRYELAELLGASGMSEVWCAVDRKLERRVALKLLAPQADTSRFEREAHAVASLAHPNVVRLYDYGEDATKPYIVLEFLSGGTLADRLRGDQPLGDGETLSIAGDVAAALADAHAYGIVHRDVKPANVLFDDEGRAKLADFGIACFVFGAGTVTEAGTLIGTASYMSPEQAAGEAATPASDVYSFGVILYQMLTGGLPFEAADPLALAALHRTASPPPVSLQRSGIPPELETTTTAALAKSPADRPADGRALLAALGGLADTGASAATHMPAAVHTSPAVTAADTAALTAADTAALTAPARRPEGRKRPLLLGATALAALALAGVVLALVVSRPGGSSPGQITFPGASDAKAKPPTTTTPSTPVTGAPARSPQTSTRSKTPRAATTPPRTAQPTAQRGAGGTTPSPATTGRPTTATQPAVSTEATTVSGTTTADTTTAPATSTTTTTTPATTASTTTASATTTTAATTTG